MSKLLFSNDDLLVISPKLAKLIGLNEAIILQQIHYWIDNKNCKGVHAKGRKWIYNTISQWQAQFPFFSPSTIKRTMIELRNSGLIFVEQLSENGRDTTNYYTIDYEKLESLQGVQTEQPREVNLNSLGGSNWSSPNRTETTTETTSSSNLADCPHQQLIDLFASKVPELPKPRIWTGKRHKDMLARWRWVMSQKAADGALKHQQTDDGIEFFSRFFDYVASSDFLTGRSGAWDKCDLPWLMKEENFAKVIEGNYENQNKGV